MRELLFFIISILLLYLFFYMDSIVSAIALVLLSVSVYGLLRYYELNKLERCEIIYRLRE